MVPTGPDDDDGPRYGVLAVFVVVVGRRRWGIRDGGWPWWWCGGGRRRSGDASQEGVAVLDILALQRFPALFRERAESGFASL
jgi:hypothetical protein